MITSAGPQYTAKQRQERADFIICLLSNGDSDLQVHRQFADKYACSLQAAANWRRWAIGMMAADQTLETRRGWFAVALELRHTQIGKYQQELIAIQTEIDLLATTRDARDQLIAAMAKASGKKLVDLQIKL
jgi:hypothetical protein